MEYYLRTYGYLGVILWTFWGGEEGVIIPAALAREGYLSIIGIILAAALGGSLGDQIYFYLTRRHGERLLKRSQRLARAYPRAERLVRKYGVAVVLISRFMLGLRVTIAVVCGIFKMPAATYSLLSFTSGLLWASLYGILTYYLGRVFWNHLRSLPGGWLGLGAGLAGTALLVWLWRRRRRKKLAAVIESARIGSPHE